MLSGIIAICRMGSFIPPPLRKHRVRRDTYDVLCTTYNGTYIVRSTFSSNPSLTKYIYLPTANTFSLLHPSL